MYNYVTIVHDPSGDFRRGAQFPTVSFRYGMEDCVWANNTIIHWNNKYWKITYIDGKFKTRQTMKEVYELP